MVIGGHKYRFLNLRQRLTCGTHEKTNILHGYNNTNTHKLV